MVFHNRVDEQARADGLSQEHIGELNSHWLGKINRRVVVDQQRPAIARFNNGRGVATGEGCLVEDEQGSTQLYR